MRRAFSVRYHMQRERRRFNMQALEEAERAQRHLNDRFAGNQAALACSSRALDHAKKCGCDFCQNTAFIIEQRINDGTYPPYHPHCDALPNLHTSPAPSRVVN